MSEIVSPPSDPDSLIVYLEELLWALSKPCCSLFLLSFMLFQMWMNVRTQPTVRMAIVWTLQGHTTASALRPGLWPLTVTVVWLLRSRLVSADLPQWGGYKEQQGSCGPQQLILSKAKQRNIVLAVFACGREYMWEKLISKPSWTKVRESTNLFVDVIVLNRGKNRHHIEQTDHTLCP